MADSQSRSAALSLRQKMTALTLFILALFVFWEVLGVLIPSKSAVAATTTPPKSLPPKASPKADLAPMTRSTAPSHPDVDNRPPSSIVLQQQEQVQNKYVSALNELQMLKIQKEIAETGQAIVAAKLATATAEKSISDLLSEGSTLPGSENEKKGVAGSTALIPPAPPSPLEVGGGYSVQSVRFEQDKWHAVVKYKEKLYDVSVGDLMPPDRSLVKQIDQSGVTLENAGLEQRIPLTMTDNEMLLPPDGGSLPSNGISVGSPNAAVPPPAPAP